MVHHIRNVMLLLMSIALSPCGTSIAQDIDVKVGPQKVLIHAGEHNLNYFPDQPVALVSLNPIRCYMAVGNSTMAFEGRTWDSLQPMKKVLEKGPRGSFDNGYAGAGGVYVSGNNVVMFYHAEDHDNLPRDNERQVQTFMGSVGAAVSQDGGRTFRRIGQVLSSRHPKKASSNCGGLGDISICVDKTNQYLLAHYVDYSRSDNQGIQSCVARCKISDAGKPGSWKKYFEGSFSEPGLGGRESHVLSGHSLGADAYSPHVVYSKQHDKYLAVFCVVHYDDISPEGQAKRPEHSGIYLAISDDAIKWEKPTKLFGSHTIITPLKNLVVHPSIHIMQDKPDSIRAVLLYGFSPRWGLPSDGNIPHHLAARMLTIKLDNDGDRDLKKQLSGTKWTNTNSVSFEWTNDGRFLHNGIEREWKVLGGGRAQITFSQHKDTLEFNSEMTEFKQLIRGGPSSFKGKRR